VLRSAFIIAISSGLFGASRGLAAFLRLFLRQDSGEALLPALARNLAVTDVLWPALGWSAIGVSFAFALARGVRRWGDAERLGELDLGGLLAELARAYLAALVPVVVILMSVAALVVSPSFPYGANLAVSVALEGPFLSLLAALLFSALLVHALAWLLGPWERPVPILAPVVLSMILFTVATPSRFYDVGVGQGNMFKYLRMAAAVTGTGTLDIERAEENPDPTLGEFFSFVPGWVGSYARASANLFESPDEDRKASRVNRSMFRSVGGGVYYINAPGPGLLLVPAYLADRVLNRWFGGNRQLAVIVFWQLLGALLVFEIVRAVDEISGRGAGVVVALAVAATVPVLFYTFQIYPELPGGLFLLFAFRKLVLDPAPTGRGVLAASLALAALPWLHQKYSVVAAVVGIVAALKLMRRTPGGTSHHLYKVVLLGAPLLVSAYSIFLFNHALTGSFSPTATFSAAGRSSFEPWNFLRGLSGLLLDRENGLFVFAPIYVLALVGARAFYLRHHRVVTPFMLVLASYLVVIASFPYWPGAVSTMGRYILSILPLLALPMALVVRRAFSDGWLAGVSVTLLAASLAYSVSFTRDLIPSYQPPLFWGRALYSEPAQYLPSFLGDGFLGSGPAHFPKVLVLVLILAMIVQLLRQRVHEEPFSVEYEATAYYRRAALGAGTLVLSVVVVGALLERWPGNATERHGPTFPETQELSRDRLLWAFGEHGFEGDGVWVPGGGSTRFLLRSPARLDELTLRLSNGRLDDNTVELRERGGSELAFELPPAGPHERTVHLRNPYRFTGPRGERYLYQFTVRSHGSFVPEGDDDRSLGTYVRVR
jgi:hypothetical protein